MARPNRVLESTPNRNVPDLSERIAQRAYQYWEARGRENGYDLEDWLKAVQELSPPAPAGQQSSK